MKKYVLGIAVIMGLISLVGLYAVAKDKEPAVSTSGVENLDQSVATSKPDAEETYDLKAKLKATKKYFKNKKAIKKQDRLRTKTVNEIEYLNKRLEQKKQQLESFNPADEKGENEE